jgi:DNA-binding NtrC family response regulator
VVEDKASLARMLEAALVAQGYRVTVCSSAEDGVAELGRHSFDVVLTDLKLPSASGIAVVEGARRIDPRLPVVVMTAFGSVESAVEAMKAGAVDFLEKPVELDELFSLVASLVSPSPAAKEIFRPVPGAPAIVGAHPTLKAALRLLEKVAPTEATVLLTGESGTGKELFARAIHGLSSRADQPFVAVNCAAIPEALVESELFGHEKGAFTGAHKRQPGRFERAARGTLFLDEIGELPLAVQSKILRVLEERIFEPVGGGAARRADVRIVAATNRPLRDMVEEGHFRPDLYFRLEVFPIHLPPLRERPQDVPVLTRHLVDRLAERQGLAPPRLDRGALDRLSAAEWPGNVRQLANVLERAVILYPGGRVGAVEVDGLLAPLETAEGEERRRLRAALERADGDKKRAAEELGWSYRTLQRRIKKHDLEGFPKYRD